MNMIELIVRTFMSITEIQKDSGDCFVYNHRNPSLIAVINLHTFVTIFFMNNKGFLVLHLKFTKISSATAVISTCSAWNEA